MPNETRPTAYANAHVSPVKKSEVTIKAEVPADVLSACERRAVRELGRDIELPGFRKGHVPEDMLRGKLDHNLILDHAAHLALEDAYRALAKDYELSPVTPPQIHVTKLALGSPLEFEARVGVYPDVRLPDYRKVGKEAVERVKRDGEPAATDAEIDETVGHLLKERGAEETGLTDEFVKSLGDFKDVEDFKAKLRVNITMEKALAQHERERDTIVQALRSHATFDIPAIAVDLELARIKENLHKALKESKQTLSDYLAKLDKTEAQFWETERERIADEIKGQILMQEIAKQEGVTPDDAAVEHHTAHMAEHYRDVSPERLREYVKTLLTYEAVFKLILQ